MFKWLLVPLVVALDLFTKSYDHFTESDHLNKVTPWWVLLGLLPLVYMAWKKSQYRLPVCVIMAGAALNFIDAQDHVVANPFILVIQTTAAAFNVADLAMAGGIVWIFIIRWKERKNAS